MIGLLVALLAAAALGALIDRLLGAPSLDLVERLGRALLFGLGGLGALSMLGDAAGLGSTPLVVGGLWAAAVALLAARAGRAPRDPAPAVDDGPAGRLLAVLLLAATLVGLASVVHAGWMRPTFQFDALTRWMFKAKVLAFDGTLMGPVSTDPAFAFTHQRYPPLVAHVAHLPALVRGDFDDRIASAVFPWFAVGLALALYGGVARATGRRWIGAVAALWVTCLPPSLYLVFPPPGAGAASAMADIPLSAFLATGGLALAAALADPTSRRRAWEAGLLLGLATLVKNEALPFVALAGVGLLALGGRARLGLTARVVLPAAVLYLLAWGLRAQGFPALDEHYPGRLHAEAVRDGLHRLGPVLAAIGREFGSADTLHRWNLTWPAALALLALAGRRLLRPAVALPLLLVVAQLGVYVFAYVVTAWTSPAAVEATGDGDPVLFLLQLTLPRLLLHVAPLLVATALIAAPLAGARSRSPSGSPSASPSRAPSASPSGTPSGSPSGSHVDAFAGSTPLLVTALLLALGATACGSEDDSDPLWPVRKQGRLIPRTYDLASTPGTVRDQPAVALRSEGAPWVATVTWDAQGDRIELRSLPDWDTAEPVVVARSETRVLGLTAECDATDTLRLVWSEQQADGWALRGLRIAPGAGPDELGAPGAVTDLVREPGAHLLDPVLVSDDDRRLLLLWRQLDTGGQRIRAATLGPDGAGPPVDVSVGDSAWAPTGTALGGGRFAVAWDTAEHGDFDVALAWVSTADGRVTVERRARVTDSPRFEAAPSLAADGDRLYVAYHVGGEGWGREGSINRLERALHSERTLELVAVEGDRVAPLAVSPTDGMKPALAGNCEQPRLMVDGGGNLLLFFRGLPLPAAADDPMAETFTDVMGGSSGGKGWRTSIWYSYWTRFDGRHWSTGDRHHAGLPGSEGRCDAPLGLTRLRGGGAGFAVVGDGRVLEDTVTETGLSWWRPISGSATDVTPGRIARGPPRRAGIALGPSRPLAELRADAARTPHAERPARTLPDGRALRLALGDLHRHTDLSRCSSNWDGPFTDALRYALDVAPLDVLALTDHFEHMTAYDWWRTLSWVEAHQLDGRLVNLRAYERADAWTGHRNVIAADDELPVVGYRQAFEPARDDARAPVPEDLWAAFASAEVLTIPHTPAGMFAGSGIVFDWSQFEPRYDRVVEIWQGYRGGSEAAEAPRTLGGMPPRRYVLPQLARGLHFGFVASSDHQSSYGAFAGIWCDELTRAGVFEALHARRTFAATAPMSLWATWGGHPMGARARHPAGPAPFTWELEAEGLWLERLDLVVDGLVTETRLPPDAGVALPPIRMTLDVPADGERVVYARALLRTGERRRPARAEAVVDGEVVSTAAFDPDGDRLRARVALPGATREVVGTLDFDPARGELRLQSPERDAQATLGPGDETLELPWAAPDGARTAWVRVVFEDLELAWTSPIRLGPDLVEGDGPDGASADTAEPLLGAAR